jgi:hypothetical protein
MTASASRWVIGSDRLTRDSIALEGTMVRKARPKSKPRKGRPIRRRKPAKDDFGEKLLKLKGRVDPSLDLEFDR